MEFVKFFEKKDMKWGFWKPNPQLSGEGKHFKDYRIKKCTGHKKTVQKCDWNLTGEYFGTSSTDKTVRVYKPTSSKPLVEFTGHKGPVQCVSWDPTDANLIASAAKDNSVRVWDVRSGNAAHTLDVKGMQINLKYSPNGNVLVSADENDILNFMDVRKGFKITMVKRFPFYVHSISFDKSEKYFLMTTSLGNIDIFDYPKINRVHSIQAHVSHAHILEMGRSGKYMATGGVDTVVQLWDVNELAVMRTFRHLDYKTKDISITSDDKFIASACNVETPKDRGKDRDPDERDRTSRDIGRIYIHDMRTGELCCNPTVNFEVQKVAWCPTQRILGVVGYDSNPAEYGEGGPVIMLSMTDSSSVSDK